MGRRTQIVLTDELYERLSRESARTGASMGELVRRAVDIAYPGEGAEDPLKVLRETAGAWAYRAEDGADGADYVERLRRGMGRRLAR
jgi:Ribbon-helix-helix protein, copG family